MTRRFFVIAVPICATLMMVGGHFARAGNPNPPAGPVAPTMKPLSEVEPRIAINATNTPGDADSLFKITQSGSYYLTGNIAGVAAKNGIGIASSGVTLDLNGFDVVGVVGSVDGVSTVVSDLWNIAVINGSVRYWGRDGINLFTNAAIDCRLADLITSGNFHNGISAGYASSVSNCSASFNGGNGISTSSGSTISGCLAYSNAGSGIIPRSGCTVLSCSVFNNSGNGISIPGSWGCIVTGCTARGNVLDGIVCLSSCVIRGNSCSSNGARVGDGAGIHVTGDDNCIEGNTCLTADRGIDVDSIGNIIIKNSCSGNATNWDIVSGNAVAPIVQATTNAAAISGDTYAGSLGSTDPNANFTY